MRTHRMLSSLLPCLAVALGCPLQSPSRAFQTDPVTEPGLRQLDLDRDGNDSWEQAGELRLAAGRGVQLQGQLGAVDRDGVLDRVDYYHFNARHPSLELHIEGAVELSLVTAGDQVVASAVAGWLWLDELSLDGGYALRIRPRSERVETYTLTASAGAHVRGLCVDTCRHGLVCADGRCAQDGDAESACLFDGDCRAGSCEQGRCQLDEPVCQASPAGEDSAGCRSCADSGDCLAGACLQGICVTENWECEPAVTRDGLRCRAAALQACSAGGWHDVGRCDTGCLADGCAPAPGHCEVEGAALCLGNQQASCRQGSWQVDWNSSACPIRQGLEGERCSSDGNCAAPFRCLATDAEGNAGVCALPCDQAGATCAGGGQCGVTLDGALFCLHSDGDRWCDLSRLDGCPGAVAGACVDGACLPGCEVASCPGPGCGCSGDQQCLLLDPATTLGSQYGVCLALAGVGETCAQDRPCEAGALCLLLEEGADWGQCFRSCQNSCPGGDSCVPIDAEDAVCVALVGVGQPCGLDTFCAGDAVCVLESSGAAEGICRASCSDGSCAGGESCVPLSDGSGACLPA